MSLHTLGSFASAFLRFIKHLLAFFGLATREPLQSYQKDEIPELTYTPAENLVLDQQELVEFDKTAARSISNTLDSVVNNKPHQLPDLPGRAELVEAMARAVKEVKPLDSLLDDHGNNPEPEPEPKLQTKQVPPPQPKPDTLNSLITASKKYEQAQGAWSEAREVESPQVRTARQRLAASQKHLDLATAKYHADKNSKPSMLKFLIPPLEKVINEEITAHQQAEKNLAICLKKFPPVIAPEINQRMKSARETAKSAGQVHHAQMIKDVELQTNPVIKKVALDQAQKVEMHLKTFEQSSFARFLTDAIQVAVYAPSLVQKAVDEAKLKAQSEADRLIYQEQEKQNDGANQPEIPK